MFYTYVHFRPVEIPFYVGKGKDSRYEEKRKAGISLKRKKEASSSDEASL